MNLTEEQQRSIDEARAIVRFRFPWWLRPFTRGILGITLGRRVYLDGMAADAHKTLRHELAHVRQIRRLGLFRFYGRFAREYVDNRRRGWPAHHAYQRISLELEALAAEREESV
jgi:hypothetical protein